MFAPSRGILRSRAMDTLNPTLAAPCLLTLLSIGRVKLPDQKRVNVIIATAAETGRPVQVATASNERIGRETHHP